VDTARREMARTGGWLTRGNPFYWFFWAYSQSYGLLSAGFSRWNEYLADRMACALSGPDVFVTALRKNIRRLLRENKAFINMYLAFRRHREAAPGDDRLRLERQLLEQPPSAFASHPTFRERAEAASRLPAVAEKDDRSSLSLFERPEEVEAELTDYLTRRFGGARA
jgi:Zn-dependent protease with chaperone function